MTLSNFFKKITLLLVFAVLIYGASAQEYPKVILRGDYPDPSIMRDGDDFYMTHSPFTYSPGFLIWHSKDLLNWEPVTRAMPDLVGSAMAPDLLKFNSKYYIYFPANGSNWVIWASDIRGPWSKPINLKVSRIDPAHAVGEDGKRYLFVSAGGMVPLSDDGLSIGGNLKDIYAGWDYPKDWITECKCLESPKIIKKGGYFYMLTAEGGTAGPATSHMVIAARSKSIHGPWENSPYNPIVHTYNADEKWWSKGHGTLIDDVKGNWWIVYHAYEKGYHTLGRQTLIEPVEWTADGWFKIAKRKTEPAAKEIQPASGFTLSDNFTEKTLGLQWTAWKGYDTNAIQLKNGSLNLKAKGSGPADAQLLLTTVPDTSYETQVEVSLTGRSMGGLILFYNEKAFAGIASDGKDVTIYESADKQLKKSSSLGKHFYLKIINNQNICAMLASKDGKNWATLQSGLHVSGLNHNQYHGFFALRPGFMSAGKEGTVILDNFKYKSIN
jgi:beta-xylosidase